MAQICGVCKENEATKECSICKIPLCEMCAQEIVIEDTHPSHRIKGETTPGLIGTGAQTKIVCSNCMTEVDIF